MPEPIKWRERQGEPLNVLSIDFDYWYCGQWAELMDSHCGFCEDFGDARLYPCIRPRSRCYGPSDRQITRKMVIEIVPARTPIFFSECHADLANLLRRRRKKYPEAQIRAWNIDEHEDVWGYERVLKGQSIDVYNLHCGGWVDWSGLKGWLDEYQWVLNLQEFGTIATPDLVYVCKSSPFLVKGGDRPLIRFVCKLEEHTGLKARVFGHASKKLRRQLEAGRANAPRRHAK